MKGPEPKPFRILSLDGGGIRGAFIAGFLADLEHRLNCHMADHFDLIAGTSTGAIIAVALALREPAEKIERFYRDRGPRIFERRKPLPLTRWQRFKKHFVEKYVKDHGLDYDQLQQSKYEAKELRAALDEVFADRKIEDAKTRLVIPAVDLTRGQTIVFKTPHMPDLFRDRHYRVVDVLMATTAAPTYFPHAVIKEGSAYVDGGLWANNPSMVAIAEVLRIREKANRDDVDQPIAQESIHLLSVGTGKASYFAKPPAGGAGAMWWAPHLFNISSVAQSQGINFQAQYILGDRLRRIDYDLPDGRWSLDSVDMLAEMTKIGHERSSENLAALRPIFFEQKAQHPYQPFPDVVPVAK
jgi:patatin-like phospholipase/acyl hydrolase